MESLDAFTARLKDLHHQAATLASAVLSLTGIIEGETDRLRREDEALCLRALHSSVKQQLDVAKRSEDSASYDHNKANSILNTWGFVLDSIIRIASKNKQVSTTSSHIFQNLSIRDRPFGKVLVSIGPIGLPGEVGVVSISEKARDSNRPESEVMNDLLKGGYLLLSGYEFSLLIDKLVSSVLQGQMCLPISGQTLSDMRVSSEQVLRVKKIA